MRAHPVEGARIIMESTAALDLAAVVAFEHHVMVDGGGYPQFHYKRECAAASRLVHVCDVYDALCTNRPYRDAWTSDRAVEYLRDRAGVEVDGPLVEAFSRMLAAGATHVRVLADDRDALAGAAATRLTV